MKTEPFGTPPQQLVRREDPDTSKQAARLAKTTKMEYEVYVVIKTLFPHGCIADELRAAMPHYAHSAHKRISALVEKGYVSIDGTTRIGICGRQQRVLMAITGG